jgi:anti-sigma B factor antagonist
MASTLDIQRNPLADGVELVLDGELDISTVGRLRDHLRDLRDTGVRAVRLDISSLQFVDSTGLRALLAAQREAEVAGWRLALTRAPAHVQQLFELTRTEGVLPFEDD